MSWRNECEKCKIKASDISVQLYKCRKCIANKLDKIEKENEELKKAMHTANDDCEKCRQIKFKKENEKLKELLFNRMTISNKYQLMNKIEFNHYLSKQLKENK